MKRIFILLLFFYFSLNNICVQAQSVGPLYGTTYNGGANGSGVIFNYDPISANVAVPFNFPNQNPTGNVIQATNGLLYGMAPYGGAANEGVLYSFNAETGQYSSLVDFIGSNGSYPAGSLIQGKDSLLYGMTSAGGTHNLGTLFSFSMLTATETVLFNFDSAHGFSPNGNLLSNTNGLLYGMTNAGGKDNYGTLFSFNLKSAVDSVLINFNDTNGANPYGSLINYSGILYGMTYKGGTSDVGVIFSYNLATGKDSLLLSFAGSAYRPYGTLLLASDSLLYGMTSNGPDWGTIFRFNPKTNQDTILFEFRGVFGKSPLGSLIQASNSLLYGLTVGGGTDSNGILFSYNISTKKDSVLVNFNSTNGDNPHGDLTEIMYATIKSTDSIKCYGDSNSTSKVNVRGAKMPVTYLWSTGATTDSVSNLKGGVYTCTVTDARGITIAVYDTVKQPAQILPNLTVINGCYGGYGNAQVNATGGNGSFKYVWNNKDTTAMIDSLKPGNDTCIIIDSRGCSVKAVAVIQTAQPLKIDSIVPTKTGCPGCTNGTVTVYVSGGIPPGDSTLYFYNWGTGFDSAATGSDSSTMSNLDTGVYYVCVLSYYGCTNGGVCDSAHIITGIEQINDIDNNVKVYPTPSPGDISISLKGNGYENMTLFDELGRNIINQLLNTQTYNKLIHLDLHQYPNGVYILQVANKRGLITKKIILQK